MKPTTLQPIRSGIIILLCAAILMPLSASALIMVGRGNDPVSDAGWPEGALTVANLKSRVGYWEGPPFGGGEWQFLYRGDTEALVQALTNFAAIRAPKLDLFLHDGPQENHFLKDRDKPDSDARADWTFTVWNPESWYRLFNNPKSVFDADHPNFRQPVDPPRLDVYIGGGKVDWTKVKVPANLTVHDERAAAAGVKMEGGAMVRADVYEMATGKPVAGARLLVARRPEGGQNSQRDYETVAEAATDSMGHAQVEKIPAGVYRFSVTAGGFMPANGLVADGYAPRVLGYEQLHERSFRSFSVELAKAETIHGQVLDTASKPIKAAKVRASSVMALNGRGYNSPDSHEVTTGDDGVFTLSGLPRGFTQLWATAPGYYFGDIFTIYDVPTTNIALRMTSGGSIHVTVTDKSGQPIGKFEGHELMVNIEPKGGSQVGSWGGGSTVKENGTVEFTEVPAGEYRITSQPNPANSTKQYAPEQIIKLEPGKRVEVKIAYE